jgi:outer membrane protein assembly factor BamB
MSARPLACLLLAVALAVLPLAARADDSSAWNQWRGPARNGSVEGPAWPQDLRGLEPLWRSEIGQGYSGPIVVGDTVYVAESSEEGTESVRALNRSDGSELWKTSWQGRGSVPFFAAANGDWIRSTPAHDGEALYVGGMEEVLLKLDAKTGDVLWRVDFPARFGTRVPDFGFVSSPMIDGDHLYVQAANSLVKLDRSTGETVWRSLDGPADIMSSGAFSSPIMATLAGERQLVTQTRTTLYGVAPDSGEVLWSHDVPSFRGMNILTPVVHGDTILTSTYKNKTYYYGVSKSSGGLQPEELWTHKSQAYMSSPVVIDGFAYLHLGNGRLACIDLESGVERWISKPFGKYWSIAVQQDKLLALDEGGELFLLRANPDQLEMLDSAEVGRSPTWAHIAVSGDQIFVRELEAIVAYRWRPADGQRVAETGQSSQPSQPSQAPTAPAAGSF